MTAVIRWPSIALFVPLVCLQPSALRPHHGAPLAVAQAQAQAATSAAPKPAPSGASDITTTAALCNRGDAKACNVAGAMYTSGLGGAKPDQTQAFTFFLKSCDGRNAAGCVNLAYHYFGGLGVAQDVPRALQVYQRSCDLGATPGCMELGVIYRDGEGVPASTSHAAQLFQRACDLTPAACASIASMYELGVGVAKDLTLAKVLYTKSCTAPRSASAEDVQATWSNASCNALTRLKCASCPSK